MNHVVTLSVVNGLVTAICSCRDFHGQARTITLDQVNTAVHEHIEAAERYPGYVTKSALTSSDQLIDLGAQIT